MDLALTCYLNPSGLSRVGQEYFRLFSGHGFRVVPISLMDPEARHALDEDLVSKMVAASKMALDPAPVQLYAGRNDGIRVLRDRTAALFSFVSEGNLLTRNQAGACAAADAVLAVSRFCRDACVFSGVPASKVHLLSYPLDSGAWNPSVAPLPHPAGAFRFLYMNSWYERKGYDVLLRAWWQEFSASDGVELVIKSYRENDRQRPLELLIAILADKFKVDRNKKAPVRVVDELMPSAEIPAFMKSFDAYVSPHRSEGFGMNPWYAMALGVPVVCTDFGGVTDFAKDDTAWLVRPERLARPSRDEAAIFSHLGNIVWAEPDVMSLRRQMRACLDNPSEREARAALGARLVSENYSYETILDGFRYVLDKVSPGAWGALCLSRDVEKLASQASPRFESVEKPLAMAEI